MYAWLKVVHVVAVVLFLGNITTGLFWHRHAARTRDARSLASTMDGIIRSDRWFTIPGVLVIIASGVAAAMLGGLPLLRTPWIAWSLALFAVSGIVFVTRLVPLQARMRALAESATESGTFDWLEYHRLTRRWEAWGAISLAAPYGALVLMVLKPGG